MQSILFPGQGSQVVGMGSEFYQNFDIVKKIFSQADDKLKFPLSKLILKVQRINYNSQKILNQQF